MYEELLAKCQAWSDSEEYDKIVELLTAFPGYEDVPELCSELGRAYNNLGAVNGHDTPEALEYFRKALSVLLPHEAALQHDHRWNYRVGFAYYYLDRPHRATQYFDQALDALPGDQDTKDFIEHSEHLSLLPAKPFKERVAAMWKAFEAREGELLAAIESLNHETSQDCMAKLHEVFRIALHEPIFELRAELMGGKPEVIFPLTRMEATALRLYYIERAMPAALAERWTIRFGRQPIKNERFTFQGYSIQDFRVSIAWERNQTMRINKCLLTFYHEELGQKWLEDESSHGETLWVLYNLLSFAVGDATMNYYVASIKVEPHASDDVATYNFADLADVMAKEFDATPKTLKETVERTLRYEMDVVEGFYRWDVFEGETATHELIWGWYQHDFSEFDDLADDGAVAGMLLVKVDETSDKDSARLKAALMRDLLATKIMEKVGSDAVQIVGRALGDKYAYLDVVGWDNRALLEAADEAGNEIGLKYLLYRCFRPNLSGYVIIDEDGVEEGGERNPEAFPEDDGGSITIVTPGGKA